MTLKQLPVIEVLVCGWHKFMPYWAGKYTGCSPKVYPPLIFQVQNPYVTWYLEKFEASLHWTLYLDN